ncbi:MAG: nitroreductase family protein [Deltaproteobacteria bacterium]|nr:nitroreductase family protein [Deltaproteobacteria bacterium]
MDVMSAIMGRRSVRRFKPLPVEPEKIETLKDALIWAPSAGNLQSRFFYFVYNDEVKKKLAASALGQKSIVEAPVVIVGCADLTVGDYYRERGIDLYCIQDLSCSIENMMLAAHALGLGSVWVGAFDEVAVAEILNLPRHLRPLAMVPAGYPAETPRPPRRMAPEEAIIEIR